MDGLHNQISIAEREKDEALQAKHATLHELEVQAKQRLDDLAGMGQRVEDMRRERDAARESEARAISNEDKLKAENAELRAKLADMTRERDDALKLADESSKKSEAALKAKNEMAAEMDEKIREAVDQAREDEEEQSSELLELFNAKWLLNRSMEWVGEHYHEQLYETWKFAFKIAQKDQGSNLDENDVMQTFLTPAEIKIIREQEVIALREGYGLSTIEKGESSGTGPDPFDTASHGTQALVIIPSAITESETDAIPPPVTEATGLEIVPVTTQEYNPDNPGFVTASASTGMHLDYKIGIITFC